MSVLELNRKESLDDADFPLRGFQLHVALRLDVGDTDVPIAAQRRIASRLLGDIAAKLHEDDWKALHESGEPAEDRPAGPARWEKPVELDLRIVKSAHRLVHEIAKRGERGRVVLASELVSETGLSAPTVGRLLREGDPAYEYLKRFVRVSPHGRTKAIDLTSEGRVLASRIRAGAAPI
jgi:hypothetical protein